jgi:hypothetical protein
MVCIILSNEIEAMEEWRKMMMFLPLVLLQRAIRL